MRGNFFNKGFPLCGIFLTKDSPYAGKITKDAPYAGFFNKGFPLCGNFFLTKDSPYAGKTSLTKDSFLRGDKYPAPENAGNVVLCLRFLRFLSGSPAAPIFSQSSVFSGFWAARLLFSAFFSGFLGGLRKNSFFSQVCVGTSDQVSC